MTKPVLEAFDNYEKQRTYDRLVNRSKKLHGIGKEVKISTIENYWVYRPADKAQPDDVMLRNCNNSFWHSRVRNINELEIAMDYIHDCLMLDYNESIDPSGQSGQSGQSNKKIHTIDTLERCVSIYTCWLTYLKESKFKYNDKPAIPNHLPEWFYDHTESIFTTMLGDLALIFNHLPHTISTDTKTENNRNGARLTELFKNIFDTIARVGDIPKDAAVELSNESIGDDISSNLCRKNHPWLWSNILKMLLYIVDRWFYSTVDPNNVPEVAVQAIKLLINAFIVASHESFPEVELWQEFEMLCQGIVHIDTVVKEWKAICETLTVQRLKRMYGSQHCGSEARNTYMMHGHMKLPSMISMMEDENMLQCWARFIVLLGNPAQLMKPNSIIRSHRMDNSGAAKHKPKNVVKREFSVDKARGIYPKVCLLMIQGISCMVNTILKVGLPHNTEYDGDRPESPDKLAASQAITRRSNIEVRYSSATHSAPSKLDIRQNRDITLDSKLIPTGNSVLRLFGEWLFECTSIIGKIDHKHEFYRASAEALGTLCYVFSHNRLSDPFKEQYMIRFVIRLMKGLKCGKQQLERDQKHVNLYKTNDILVKILQQSGSLFKVDLPGINALVASYISVIERVLSNHVNDYAAKELRRDAIEILLSVVCLPLRYPTIALEDLEGDSKLFSVNCRVQLKTMGELWSKCVEILDNALKNSILEDDPINKSQIMKGLYILLLDKRHHDGPDGHDGHDGLDGHDVTMNEDYSSQTSPVNKYSEGNGNIILENKTSSTQSIIMDDVGEYTVQELWMRMIKLICEILESTSRQEVKFWYVPFGILCGLANIFSYHKGIQSGYEDVISNLCKYIECLSKKPTTQHREELHTMLAAAYNCLTVWCLNYTELFTDGESLFKCLQVIELGVSSGCSYNHERRQKIMKNDKKKDPPISQRVGDKAEFLLKQLNNNHPISEHDTRHNLSERQLLAMWASQYPDEEPRLQYLVVEGSIILCLINPPRSHTSCNGYDTPILYMVQRDPDISLSVHWFKYEKDPLTEQSAPRKQVPRPKVPEQNKNQAQKKNENIPRWPDCLSTKYKYLDSKDTMSFEDVQEGMRMYNVQCLRTDTEHNMAEYLTEDRLREEIKESARRTSVLNDPPPPPDLQIPPCVESVDSARLFLAHAGYLTPAMFEGSKDRSPPVTLLKNSAKLQQQLQELDSIPTRDCHTVVVLYMKTGQNSIKEILRNTNVLSSNKEFHNFVVELGNKIVDVSKFDGWTGLQPFENWSNKNIETSAPAFPYYSDSFNEMVFLLPNLIPSQENVESPRGSSPDSETPLIFDEEFSQASITIKGARSYYQRDLLENILWEVPSDVAQLGKDKLLQSKIVVVWAESFDDTRRFLINNLALGLDCDKDARCVVIFIHALQSGLFKTSIRSLNKTDKFNTGGILDEKEKVVSREILGYVVRETCLAIRTSSLLEQSPKLRPKSRRQSQIERIVNEHRSLDMENGYYNAFCKEH